METSGSNRTLRGEIESYAQEQGSFLFPGQLANVYVVVGDEDWERQSRDFEQSVLDLTEDLKS